MYIYKLFVACGDENKFYCLETLRHRGPEGELGIVRFLFVRLFKSWIYLSSFFQNFNMFRTTLKVKNKKGGLFQIIKKKLSTLKCVL